MNKFAIGISVVVIGLIGFTIYDKLNTDDWDAIIKDHRRVSDSLKTVVASLDVQVHKKDSIMLTYMSSLDKTLEELNKEAHKNLNIVKENLADLDTIRLEYCQEMAKLDLTPADCK